MPTNEEQDLHFQTVINALKDRRLIPFFGAGVHMCDRPKKAPWKQGTFLPSGGELADFLAGQFAYPAGQPHDLLRVSQFAYAVNGWGPLYEALHGIFNAAYPPSCPHRFFAQVPRTLKQRGYPAVDDPYRPRFLVVTTNYDSTLEAVWRAAGEPFHVVTYLAESDQRGKFEHLLPDGTSVLIDKPNEYKGLNQDDHPAIIKIHGAVGKTWEQDSYVITEDHYISYLAHTEITQLLPSVLSSQIKNSHFLFLGYSLSDWNLRAILHRIWGDQRLKFTSWSVQIEPSIVDEKLWSRRGVEIFDMNLHDYAAELSRRFAALPPAKGAPAAAGAAAQAAGGAA